MLPLNYAILKLFGDGSEHDVKSVMDELRGDYGKFRPFKPAVVNESLMSAEKNELLVETRAEFDEVRDLRVFYKATDYGIDMIRQYIKVR